MDGALCPKADGMKRCKTMSTEPQHIQCVQHTHRAIQEEKNIKYQQQLTSTCLLNASIILMNIFISVEFYSFQSISQSNPTFHGHISSPSVIRL